MKTLGSMLEATIKMHSMVKLEIITYNISTLSIFRTSLRAADIFYTTFPIYICKQLKRQP